MDELKINISLLIGLISLLLVLASCSNACSADEWNNGICPKCETRYELCGVYKMSKYYACPDCGNEITRY